MAFYQFEGYVYLVIMLAMLALKSFAFISSLLFPAEAYVATGKLTKPAWSIILGLGLLAQVLLLNASPINLIHLAFTIAALVYLADVRPPSPRSPAAADPERPTVRSADDRRLAARTASFSSQSCCPCAPVMRSGPKTCDRAEP